MNKFFSITTEWKNKKCYKKVVLGGISFKFRSRSKERDATTSSILSSLDFLYRAIDIANFPPATGALALVQKADISILNYFNKICEKYHLKYWIDSGTLIGYLRHKGFIPWDDDIDICMMREDYERLPSILERECTNNGFSWRDGEIIQLFYKNVPAWVDVFPMDRGNSVEPPKGKEYERFVSILDKIKSHMDFDANKWSKRQRPVSKNYLDYCFKARDTVLVPQKKTDGFIFYGVETGVKNRCCYLSTDIFPLVAISFCGIPTYMPQNSTFYLWAQYGDFMNRPACFSSNHGENLAKQISLENIKNCQKLIQNYFPRGENENR